MCFITQEKVWEVWTANFSTPVSDSRSYNSI
jgi:hypothetical protein